MVAVEVERVLLECPRNDGASHQHHRHSDPSVKAIIRDNHVFTSSAGKDCAE